jgi:hypothetical protein
MEDRWKNGSLEKWYSIGMLVNFANKVFRVQFIRLQNCISERPMPVFESCAVENKKTKEAEGHKL